MNLKEFENWALAQKSVGNPDSSNSYKGECVSLIQQYINKCYNIPFVGRGNAIDWQNNPLKNYGFTKVTGSTKAGDVVVYGKPYGYSSEKNAYLGHIGLITSDGKFLEQNYPNRGDGPRITSIRNGYIAILRPSNIDLNESSNIKKYTTGTYKVTASLLNVRTGASTNYIAKKYNQLSTNAQNQNRKLGNEKANGYLRGVVCTVIKVQTNWRNDR